MLDLTTYLSEDVERPGQEAQASPDKFGQLMQ